MSFARAEAAAPPLASPRRESSMPQPPRALKSVAPIKRPVPRGSWSSSESAAMPLLSGGFYRGRWPRRSVSGRPHFSRSSLSRCRFADAQRAATAPCEAAGIADTMMPGRCREASDYFVNDGRRRRGRRALAPIDRMTAFPDAEAGQLAESSAEVPRAFRRCAMPMAIGGRRSFFLVLMLLR